MKFGFFADQDTTRYCYLRLRRLKAAVKDARIVDALVETLEVSVADGRAKMAAVENRIDDLRGTKGSLWFEVPAPEVLAASIFKARAVDEALVNDLFKAVPSVQDLSAPLVGWMDLAGLTPHQGGVPGTGAANIVGYRGGAFVSAPRVVGIAAINDVRQLERTLAEAAPSSELTHASYVACTPALAAAFLWTQSGAPGVARWDADALGRRLRKAGYGLLLVEGEAVAQAILPIERRPDKAMLQALAVAIQSGSKAGR